MSNAEFADVLEQLKRIETVLDLLVRQQPTKDWYTIAEVAQKLGKAEFTVREWCRLRRIQAEKRPCGRGNNKEWIISREELERIRNHGLLPDPARYRHFRAMK